MNNLYEPKSGVLTVRYLPDGEVCNENPPRFSWIPTNEENKWYVLQISKDENFSKEGTITYKDLPYNFFAPDKCLECGKYFWRYGLQSKDGISYSSVRNFTIDENAVRTPVPSYKTRFKDVDCSHPRIW